MSYNIVKIAECILKLILRPDHWKYRSTGYCPSCDARSIFVYSEPTKKQLSDLIAHWNSGSQFKEMLLERENSFCGTCNANYRMRALAETVLKLLDLPTTGALIKRLMNDSDSRIYETAAYLVFRAGPLKKLNNYVVSEYIEKKSFGASPSRIRNENLESLTFPDNTFNILMSSDVLEHVHDLNKALAEIRRVLKPGGFHVFTVPVDHELPRTTERARIVGEKIEHLLEPVMHGDSIRTEGILAFRDFGNDVLDYMSDNGSECKEFNYFQNDKLITSVYYEQKNAD
jgi:SAM-dependent methyltransferase